MTEHYCADCDITLHSYSTRISCPKCGETMDHHDDELDRTEFDCSDIGEEVER